MRSVMRLIVYVFVKPVFWRKIQYVACQGRRFGELQVHTCYVTICSIASRSFGDFRCFDTNLMDGDLLHGGTAKCVRRYTQVSAILRE